MIHLLSMVDPLTDQSLQLYCEGLPTSLICSIIQITAFGKLLTNQNSQAQLMRTSCARIQKIKWLRRPRPWWWPLISRQTLSLFHCFWRSVHVRRQHSQTYSDLYACLPDKHTRFINHTGTGPLDIGPLTNIINPLSNGTQIKKVTTFSLPKCMCHLLISLFTLIRMWWVRPNETTKIATESRYQSV